MAITLFDLTDEIRTMLLDDALPDEGGLYKFTAPHIKFAIWWATDQFANHTAQASSVSFDATVYDYALPSNRFDGDKIDTSASVWLLETSSGIRTYLDPVEYSSNLERDTGYGFYTFPDDVLHLTSLPRTGNSLGIDYFAFYDHPETDTDLVTIPRWAISSVCYLAAAHVLSNESLKTANIRQYAADQDKGTPEHNPLVKQQENYICLYERELAKHMPQDRTNMFRMSERI